MAILNPDELSLRFDAPAANWNEALPLGNGFLGAMVYGQPWTERLQLNEDSLWYGGARDRNNPDALAHLAQLRSLLFAGRIREAENLAALVLTGVPEGQRHYEPLGDLYLFFDGPERSFGNYERRLDLSTAEASTSWIEGPYRQIRRAFVSNPDQVLVVTIETDDPSGLNFYTQLARGNECGIREPADTYAFRYNVGFNAHADQNEAWTASGSILTGVAGGQGGVDFAMALQVQAEGGAVRTLGNAVRVEGASSVRLLLAGRTSFRSPDPLEWCKETVLAAARCTFAELRDRHRADHNSLFDTCDFHLGSPDVPDARSGEPTPRRLASIAMPDHADDPGLVRLLFHFGRYLLIASSRPGSLPANLQGIWNKDMVPVWDSKYTININTQMNYWPAEVAGLSACHEPLFDLVERLRVNGRRTARVMYGCNGFMAHHNTDIWADTAPQDVCASSTYWTLGAAWLSLHLWEHYRFDPNPATLKRALPVLCEAAEFVLDFLVESPEGLLTICPSLSPENTYRLPGGETGVLCYGATMDNQICRELFLACRAGARDWPNTGDESSRYIASIVGRIDLALPRLGPTVIGSDGRINEWSREYDEPEPGHRHISHLFALHPGTQITPRSTPDLARSALKTLDERLRHGGGHTGWSRAWIINLEARLGLGDRAAGDIVALLAHSTQPNLLDSHPPFQIDGNFGATAGIAEMLVQSHGDSIELLPALPAAWPDGFARGLRARGGFTIDLEWAKGGLQSLTITGRGRATLRYRDRTASHELRPGQTLALRPDLAENQGERP